MTVYGKCKSCKKEISFSTRQKTRVCLSMKQGEFKTLNCQNCGNNEKFHVDDLYAKSSKIAQIIALLALLSGILIVFFALFPLLSHGKEQYFIYIDPAIIVVPAVVFALIKKQDRNRVNAFNRHKLKSRIRNIREGDFVK